MTSSNAKLYGNCKKSSSVKITNCGVYLGTSTSSMLKLNTESVPSTTNNHNNGTSFDIWYDLGSELNVKLCPGVTYYYQFYCTYNNKEYTSNISSFTTQGTHQCDSTTYTWSNDHTTCTANITCSIISSHNQSETVYSIIEEIPATEASEGSKTYTAKFTNPSFQTQTYQEVIPVNPLADPGIKVTALTESNLGSQKATINARCEKKSAAVVMESYGIYLGTSKDNLFKVETNAIPAEANQYNEGKYFSLQYNLSLKNDGTFYYQFFCTYQGKEYTSDICSFTTTQELIDGVVNTTIQLSNNSFAYDKKIHLPEVTIIDGNGQILTQNADYTITYDNNSKNIGTYEVVVNYIGKYTGTRTVQYQIIPKATAIKKSKVYKKSAILTWNHVYTCSSYRIKYSTNPSFTNEKQVWAKGSLKTAKWLQSLSKSTTYYVQIQSYKDVKKDGKTTRYYSDWSNVYRITTKN